MKISEERWKIAQENEFKFHLVSDDLRKKYEFYYNIILDYLKISKQDLKEKKILEIGPAFYPALLTVETKQSYALEPLYSNFPKEIKTIYSENNITVIEDMGENLDKLNLKFDEIWIFNLLQHVQDPEKILKNCHNFSSLVRIFEPIDWHTDICHPHKFDFNFFKNIFPETEFQIHKGGSIADFHEANCIYGTIKGKIK